RGRRAAQGGQPRDVRARPAAQADLHAALGQAAADQPAEPDDRYPAPQARPRPLGGPPGAGRARLPRVLPRAVLRAGPRAGLPRPLRVAVLVLAAGPGPRDAGALGV